MKKIAFSISVILLFQSLHAVSSIPGPRDCFWMRGPHSGDPYINLAYPDANVFYWAAAFSAPDDAELYLEENSPTPDTCLSSATMAEADQLNR